MAFQTNTFTNTNSTTDQHQVLKPSAAAISTAAAVAALNCSFQPQTNNNINVNLVEAAHILSANAAGTATGIRPSSSSSNKQKMTQATTAYHQAPFCHSNTNDDNFTRAQMVQQHPVNIQSGARGKNNRDHTPFASSQPMSFNSSHSYSYHKPVHVQDCTPAIFQKVPLRRGKWTAEEETFANAIIEAFEKGTIHGCENGCTLRAYLSRRLHCQPMRISKKYARKSIGKQVFLSRLNDINVSGSTVVSSNMESLKQLEFQFHMSVIQEGADYAAAHHHHQNTVNGQGGFMNPYLGAWHQQQQMKASSTNVNTPTTVFIPQPVGTKATTNGHAPQPNVTTTKTIPTGAFQNDSNCIVANTNNNKSKAPQSLFETFDMAQTSYKTHKEHSNEMHENLFNAFQQAQKVNDKSDMNVSSSASTINPTHTESILEISSGQAQQNWINETMAIIPTLDPSNYNSGRLTPTYTSKSFDDLHQFIGKDLPLNRPSASSTQEKQTLHNVGGPATDATNKMSTEYAMCSTTVTHHQNIQAGIDGGNEEAFINPSDEYAYYAAQSIMEASQHSAYRTSYPTRAQPKEKQQKRCDTPTVPHLDIMRNNNALPSRPSTFSKVNVKLHAKSQENKKVIGRTQCISSSTLSLDPQSSQRIRRCNPTPVSHKETPVVGSSSRGGSLFGSGSDDNSDSALVSLTSDEGPVFSLEKKRKRKALGMDNTDKTETRIAKRNEVGAS